MLIILTKQRKQHLLHLATHSPSKVAKIPMHPKIIIIRKAILPILSTDSSSLFLNIAALFSFAPKIIVIIDIAYKVLGQYSLCYGKMIVLDNLYLQRLEY